MRKVTVYVMVQLELEVLDPAVDINAMLDDMDYEFKSKTDDVDVVNTTLVNYEWS